MSFYISKKTRRFVERRANFRCEYCLLPQLNFYYKHQSDHIRPKQHGGNSSPDNLAFACVLCNRYKGANIGSFDPETNLFAFFFNPRKQIWSEHFALEGALIRPLTAEGRVTVTIFRLNDEERIIERERLIVRGLYGDT